MYEYIDMLKTKKKGFSIQYVCLPHLIHSEKPSFILPYFIKKHFTILINLILLLSKRLQLTFWKTLDSKGKMMS